MDKEKTIYQNTDLEGKVIGACITDETYIRLAMANGITPATFTVPQNSVIFATLLELLEQNVPMGLESISIRLPNLMTYMVELMDASPSNVMFEDWVMCLRQLEADRNAHVSLANFEQKMQEQPFSAQELEEELRQISEKYAATIQIRGARDASDVGSKWLNEMQDNTQQINIPLLKGANITFKHGWMFVLGADTGSGKTAFSAGAVNCMVDAGYTVLYVCSETRAEDIYGRFVAARCGVEEFRFRDRTASAAEWDALAKAHAELQMHSKQMFYHCLGDNASMKPSSIIASCDNVIRKSGKLDVVVLDFLQGLSPDAEKRNDTTTAMVKRILETVEDYATRKHIAVLVISQYSREGRKALLGGDVPQKEWLKDSGSIEELAYVVAHLVRVKDGDREKIYLWCPPNSKHRNCPPFKHELRWTGATYELAPSANANADDIPNF